MIETTLPQIVDRAPNWGLLFSLALLYIVTAILLFVALAWVRDRRELQVVRRPVAPLPRSDFSLALEERSGPVIPVAMSQGDASGVDCDLKAEFVVPSHNDFDESDPVIARMATRPLPPPPVPPRAPTPVPIPVPMTQAKEKHVPRVERVEVPSDFRPTVEVRVDPEMLAELGIDPNDVKFSALQEGSKTRPESVVD